MLVRASKLCSYRGHRRRIGEVFVVPDDVTLPAYLERVPDDTRVGKPQREPMRVEQKTILDLIREQERQQTLVERQAAGTTPAIEQSADATDKQPRKGKEKS